MTKSLDAALSPNEEVTLRRVALGSLDFSNLSARHITRLRHLMLVVMVRGRPELTTLGRQRYEALPRPMQFADPPEDVAVLLRCLVMATSRH